jgi:thioredoxin reductase (NADPH)
MVSRFKDLEVETTFGRATSIRRDTGGFLVTTDVSETLEADVVVIATGSEPRSLGIVGENKFQHRGVSHCAACDGPLYSGKSVVVVGGGDGAADSALALQAAGAHVTLVHRGKSLHAASALRSRVESASDIDIRPESELTEIRGENSVSEVTLHSNSDGSASELPTDGVFTAVGITVDVAKFADELARDEDGRLLVDAYQACSEQGIFAAGSVRQGSSDQLAGAIGDGTNAAVNALRWWNGELEIPAGLANSRASGHGSQSAMGSYAEYFDAMDEAGNGDGLPLVPPTPERTGRFLAAAGIDAGQEIDGTDQTAQDVAACAVAAGCRSEYAGIVFAAALSLAANKKANTATAQNILEDSVLAVVVNGPVRLAAEINCSDGLLGPGWRANASIGRALRLFATGPLGVARSSGFGDPGQYTVCFGEDEEKSEWVPLQVERGFSAQTSTVTVFPAAIYRQVMDRAHQDSHGIVDYLNLFIRGRASGTSLFSQQPLSLMIVIGQELRRLLSPDYSKESLRMELHRRITADDDVPFGPVSVQAEDLSIVAAGGVAFPTAWVFTSPASSPITIPVYAEVG